MCSRLLFGSTVVSSYLILENCLLRRTLMRWSARFTSHEGLRFKLVEDTINQTLRKFPLRDDGTTIDVELFATMRQIFLAEFTISSTHEETVSDQHDAPTL